MSRPSAPSMPTERQIQEALKAVASLYPGVRIARVGPEGVTFEYPDNVQLVNSYSGTPFAAERRK
ncbi:hypothetical protein [Paenirhodobacter populi]|uniref:Uncharacterized protein n=1 Tax=Paenirhodobacter populi TaxID=2306993 RepID=A0A443J1Q1_9RHOB|nr:hypothetical protein [Sinirhodobacter populi]RWR14305.1 hypothetical protein D2T33_03580 [Sinirhodobacter populi]